MKRKQALALFLTAAMAVSMLAGCGSSNSSDSAASSTDSSAASEEADAAEGESAAAVDVPAFEDIDFPESMPTNPTLAEDDYYAYDDMSVHYELEFLNYNYGIELPDNDPIKAWLEEKYNVTITATTCAAGDRETILSTRFADGDVPDLFCAPSKDFAFTLGEQGLLVDASELYPYMPQTQKFVTDTLITYSTMDNGGIPFVTKYAIQDGDIWGLAIRQDWLDNLGMEMPTTLDEIKEYARAVTFDDPDGNGEDDTWFMTGAGSGTSFNMLNAFAPWFGNTQYTVAEDGTLDVPMLNGSRKEFISFLNELYSMNVFAPDWFTIDWETAKSYTMQNKIGMVNYPSGSLYTEYMNAGNTDMTAWKFLDTLPEGAKSNPGGNPGVLWCVPQSAVEGDQGKLMRICHILDAMCYGGEAYFATVQGGGNEVFENYDGGQREYTEDGFSWLVIPSDHPGYTGEFGTDNLMLAPWQNYGYTLKWELVKAVDDADDVNISRVEMTNDGIQTLASLPRWNNDALKYTIPGDTAPDLSDYVIAQEYKFVVGERSMDEWDVYVEEWLERGGQAIMEVVAEQLGATVPEN